MYMEMTVGVPSDGIGDTRRDYGLSENYHDASVVPFFHSHGVNGAQMPEIYNGKPMRHQCQEGYGGEYSPTTSASPVGSVHDSSKQGSLTATSALSELDVTNETGTWVLDCRVNEIPTDGRKHQLCKGSDALWYHQGEENSAPPAELHKETEFEANLQAAPEDSRYLYLEYYKRTYGDTYTEEDTGDTYWKWDMKRQQWFHTESDTGSVVWFPRQLDTAEKKIVHISHA